MARSMLMRRKPPEAGRGETPGGDVGGRVLAALESGVLRSLWALAGALPPASASALGARFFGFLGPRLHKHRHVRANLDRALPGRAEAERSAIARGVWRNLGAVFAEYPHLGRITAERIEAECHPGAREILERGRQAIYVSGHLGNWELAASAIAREGVPLSVVYTPFDDAPLDACIARFRTQLGCEMLEKSEAARGMIRAWSRGRSLGLVADQRVDDGVALPLFGEPAWTSTTPARLALRFGAPMVPMCVERLPRARFRVRFDAPIEPPAGQASREAAEAMTATFLERLEGWILAHPEQWMCTKRRWPKRRGGAG